MAKTHSFHIPVMGIGYTIDTPLKVSQYGIDSVVSLVDDMILEKFRKLYSNKYKIPYEEITEKIEDFRAKRITSYLNLMNDLAEKKFEEYKATVIDKGNDIKEYFNSLPDTSTIKKEFKEFSEKNFNIGDVGNWIKENLSMGSIDVNIMTKVDKDNYSKGKKLPVEYNDAHAALRGFAKSNLHSSIILSAGMNPRLYSYIEHFNDFFPDETGEINKKIVLKVSDYRSALIQGKFMAKKGLWVSEYRIESGLNCGGHAFATDGFLLGPVLSEFKEKRQELIDSTQQILVQSLERNNRLVPNVELPIKITAQGGVGTAEEHDFLLEHYQLDSVGWGTPFLLVPEATTVDNNTINQLMDAKEDDLYLSNISPLGVPFNSMKGNTKDIEKLTLMDEGKPGSKCPKRYVALNSEFTDKGLCTASASYQRLKLKELDGQEISAEEYKKSAQEVMDKSCICVGLGTSALIANGLATDVEGQGVSVCPGPNMAYFSKKMNLKEIIDHIYGRANVISRMDRPNMFMKELNIYMDYLKERVDEAKTSMTNKQEKYLLNFTENMKEGVSYYQKMFGEMKDKFEGAKSNILTELDKSSKTLQNLSLKIKKV